MEAVQRLSLGVVTLRSDLQQLAQRLGGDKKRRFRESVSIFVSEWTTVPPEMRLKVRAVLRRYEDQLREIQNPSVVASIYR